MNTLCPDCDLILSVATLKDGQYASCPRCHAKIRYQNVGQIEKMLAFSLTGLFLAIPANIFPILTFNILDFSSTNTMLNGAVQLWNVGFWWMAFLVLMCSVVVPLLNLILLCAISLRIKWSCPQQRTMKMIVAFQKSQEWGMLEVYMLGILVAYIKMLSMGTLSIGLGLFCYTAMLVVTVLAISQFNAESLFVLLEKKQKAESNV